MLESLKPISFNFNGIFFQNNTHFQTILLVSIISKLFKKLTSWACKSRVHCSNSSSTNSICIKIQGKSSLTDSSSSKPKNQNLQGPKW